MANAIRSRIGTKLLLVGFLLSFPAGRVWAQCFGDCNGDGMATAGDLTKIIAIINYCPCGGGPIGGNPNGCAALPVPATCSAADRNGNGCITAGELTGVIQDMINFTTGCPPAATPTSTQPANTFTPTNTQPANTFTPTNTQPANTFTPTNTQPANTFTPTNTQPANTFTPTNTQPANTFTPTNTQPANTSTPTNTVPANTATPTTTNTPTNTTAPSPTPTNTTGATAKCGDGVKDTSAGEQCDDGGTCVGGPNDGQKCPAGVASVPGGVDCGSGKCTPFGGDGCAANCTTEVSVAFNFSGGQCFGGANIGKECTFKKYCVGGSTPGKLCTAVACGTTGVCTDECGLTSLSPTGTATADGSQCEGLGLCTAGDANLLNTACPSSTKSQVPPAVVKICSAGTKKAGGIPCIGNSDCGTGGACTNPCSPTSASGVCTHQSGAVLEANAFPTILGIGPLSGGQDLMVGQALASDPAKMLPIAIPAASVLFKPVRVPPLACACPHGVAAPDVHGPGNSGSGFIGCSSSGLTNANVGVSYDHNTSPPLTCLGGTNGGATCNPNHDCPGGTCVVALGQCSGGTNNGNLCDANAECNGTCLAGANLGASCHNDVDCNGPKFSCSSGGCNLNNGPGVCTGGTRPGLACGLNSDCGSGGTCSGTGQGGGLCIGGTNVGKVCHLDADCPGSICNSPDDTTGNCSLVDPAPPAGSGLSACLESKLKCFNGPTPGLACHTDSDCGPSATCGLDCNPGSPHLGVCNSPTHLTFSGGASPMGTGLIVTTTAIGVIATPADNGQCTTAAVCMPLTFGGAQTNCAINADCTGATTTCATAFCAGLCAASSPVPGAACTSDLNCGGTTGSCVAGAKYGIACTAASDPVCGAANTCAPVQPAKGFDGIPCTADDPPASKGIASTIPTTTGIAAVNGVDVNDVPGTMSFGSVCSGKAFCLSSAQGVPFNCTSLMSGSPSTAHASLVSAFPQVDAATTGDSIVTNRQTAK